MLEIIAPKEKNCAIVTLAVGKEYLKAWEKYSKPSWVNYCKKYGIGLYVETKDLDFDNPPKKKQWQKLLLGTTLNKLNPKIETICYIDTDVLINEFAPNIFDYHIKGTVGLISQFNNLPLERLIALRRVAFLRKNFISDNYPLDSALFMENRDLYAYQQLEPQTDFACSGVILFDSSPVSFFMRDIFKKYKMPINSITDGGEEAHVNYEIQNNFSINWLDYKFQALWVYEIAWKYPFLYLEPGNQKLTAKCIRSSLMGNYFLHFSGSWAEGNHWENKHIFNSKVWNKMLKEYFTYLKTPVTGNPVGKVLPKKHSAILQFSFVLYFNNLRKRISNQK
jgi:hypothetical protein